MSNRLFDILVAGLSLLLLTPFMLAIALFVRLGSRGPVFFRQWRVGLNGKQFRILKFRTMRPRSIDGVGTFEPGDMSRITRVGRYLRKTKLDELPQLWNVLVGEMALVGPRPEVPQWVEVYPDRWAKVHTVRPGLTDPASLLYRNEETILAQAEDPEKMYREVILPHKLDLYEDYVRNRSFGGDVLLLIKTVLAIGGFGRRASSSVEA